MSAENTFAVSLGSNAIVVRQVGEDSEVEHYVRVLNEQGEIVEVVGPLTDRYETEYFDLLLDLFTAARRSALNYESVLEKLEEVLELETYMLDS